MQRSLAFAALALCAAIPAAADDVTDAIDEARSAYEGGDLGYAKESLDFAAGLIAQQRAQGLGDLLPAPLAGWTATASGNAAAAALGMGLTAERTYKKDGANVTVRLVADSPMITQMGVMFSNPAMIAASGGTLMRFGRQKAMASKEGDITFIVDNRILVQVEGRGDPADRRRYAEAIDLEALEAY